MDPHHTTSLIGRLTRTPEMRKTANNKSVCNFRLAVPHQRHPERGEIVAWFNITTWNNLAEVCSEHLVKGQRVFVQGALQEEPYIWTNSEGEPKASYQINARQVIFLDKPGGNAQIVNDDDGDEESPF